MPPASLAGIPSPLEFLTRALPTVSASSAGGMATVYLAHDLEHDRDVAIKVLHPDCGAALGGERFLSEINTTAKLSTRTSLRCWIREGRMALSTM